MKEYNDVYNDPQQSDCRVFIIHQLGTNAKWREMLATDGVPRYYAYLLRCWEVRSDRPDKPSAWRFNLEEAGTGERRPFGDLEALLAYLERQFGARHSVR
jgi:hypothetical protein